MPTVRKLLRRIFPVLVIPAVFAGALGIKASFGNSSATASKPTATAAASATASAEVQALLEDGKDYTAEGYFERTSPALVKAAAGGYNAKFYGLGELLVKDGFSNTIIDLGREMNGTWYEWSEHRAPSSQPD